MTGDTDWNMVRYEEAVAIQEQGRSGSTSHLQRKMGVGYNQAVRYMERMEAEGIISPPNESGARKWVGRPASPVTGDTRAPVDGLVELLREWAECDVRANHREIAARGPEALDPKDLLIWADMMDRAAEALTAARQRIAELTPPDGWVLVPREPSPAMIEAVWKATLGGTMLSAERAARAMIAAAPSAPDAR